MDGRGNRDADMVQRARQGDLDAFDTLIRRHRSRLYHIARQITFDREAAQDVLQNALVNAFRALGGLREEHRFGEWLNSIVRREAQSWVRSGERQPEPMDLSALRGVPSIWSLPPEPPGELVERVRNALSALAQRERRAMILRYLEGRSYQEIASHLHIPIGSVRRILHNSRRKVREECETMATAERKPGPRKLVIWSQGSYEYRGDYNLWERFEESLVQTICLAANKRPKSIKEIAEEAAAHPDYVSQTVDSLTELEVLVSPQKGKYLANFLALDAQDWRRLVGPVKEPAGAAAKSLAAGEKRLRAAFEKTPLAASGWKWADVIWVVYGVLVTNFGACRALSPQHRPSWPTRPHGRYWLGGHEEDPGFGPVWMTGCNMGGLDPESRWGWFWTYGLNKERPSVGQGPGDRVKTLWAFADDPLTETEAVTRLGGDPEHWRCEVAELVKSGFLRKADGKYRLAVPLFTRGDSDVLTPEIDALIAPVTKEVSEPALQGVDALLDEMGYGLRRDNYPVWCEWVHGRIMGESLRFLMEQGVLPRPPDPAPETFGFVAWKGDLPLMSWGWQ